MPAARDASPPPPPVAAALKYAGSSISITVLPNPHSYPHIYVLVCHISGVAPVAYFNKIPSFSEFVYDAFEIALNPMNSGT